MSYKYTTYRSLPLFVLMLLFQTTLSILDISNIQLNSSMINTKTQYQFNIDRYSQTQSLPADAYIQITFPTAYIGLVGTTSGVANCSTVSWNGNIVSCTYQNNILKIDNGFPTSVNSGSFVFVLNNVTNPSPALTYNYFSINIYYPGGGLFQTGNTNYSVTLTVATSSCSYTLNNGIVSSMGSINVTYTSSNILTNLAQYGMIVSMPSNYPDDITQININASIASAVNTGAYLFNLSYTTNLVINLMMPPSVKQQANFILVKAYLSGSNGGDIDMCLISLSGVQPNTILIEVSPTVTQVQQSTPYLFSILPSTTIQPTDSLIIAFDSNFGFANLQLSAIFTNGIFGSKSFSLNQNYITFSGLNSAALSKVRLNFTLTNITNPYDTRSSQIRVSIITQTLQIRSQSNYTISMTSGIITINAFSCNIYQIGYSSICQLNFTAKDSFLSTGMISINFPTSFPLLNSALINCSMSSALNLIQAFINCRTISNGTYELSNFSSTLANLSDTFIFKFQMIGTNDFRLVLPKDVGTYAILINTLSSSYLIDSGTFNLTTSQRQLQASNNNSVSLSKSVTYTLSTIYSIYTLPFDLGYSYTMQIILPLDLNTNSSGISSNYGTITGYDSATKTIALSGIYSPTSNISIFGFKSYVSTKAFSIQVNFLYNGKVYFYYSQNLQMVTPKDIDYFSLSQNQQQVVYTNVTATMTISQLSPLDLITFTTNNYSGFYSSVQSSCSSSVIACNVNNTLTVNSPNNLNLAQSLTQFSFNLRTQPYVGIAQFSLLILDSTGTYSKQKTSFNLITSTRNIIKMSYNSSNPYLNQTTTYSMELNLTTPNATLLKIVFPTSYTYISQQCIGNCVYQSFTGSTNLIIFTVSSVIINVQITVKNPFQFNQSIFITSLGANGDQDFVSFTPTLSCGANCRSCSSTNASFCNSCYSYVANNKLSQNICSSSCLSTQYLITNNTLFYCVACPVACFSCTTSTNCSSCVSPNIYFNFSCRTVCPSGYYQYKTASIDECMACQNICSTCLSQNYCTGCVSGYYVNNNTCVTDCPVGLYIKSGFCVNCQLNCVTCNDVTALCTICATNYFQFSGQCFLTCPPNYYKSISGTCQTCKSPCLTCNSYSTNCTACVNSSYYFLNNQCFLSACPGQYYKVQSNKTCANCVSPCLLCTSATVCSSCISNYSYKAGVCYENCPIGTYTESLNASSICINCVWPCISCNSSSVCTGCSAPQYVLFNGTCATSCLSLYFKNSNNQCQSCLYPCNQCTSTTSCVSCQVDLYLTKNTCVSSCTYPLYPNSAKSTCQTCQIPCASCFNESTICNNCITGYSILNSSCYKPCPSQYYASQNYVCTTCASQNQYCDQCSLNSNLDISCSSCVNNSMMYGYTCLLACPAQTTVQGTYCISPDCSNLSYCLTCSGAKCISCHALYSPTNGVCQQVSLAQALTAVRSIPMPFPFLILALLTIISSFFLKCNFLKMFVPLYLYSICGLIEVGCLCLWTVLSVLTAQLNNQNLSSIDYSPVLILLIYFGFNMGTFLFTLLSIQKDKKYRTWQKQDNKSVSTLILIVSFAISFRFSVIKFSKLGHKQCFSAILESGQKYSFFSFLSILSVFCISILTILASGYITYIQTSLNYLFFTSIQIVVVEVIMIILCILQVLAPKDYLVQKKQQYQKGYLSDNMEGQSIEEMMLGIGVVQQFYHQSKSINSDQGHEVINKNIYAGQDEEQQSKIQMQSQKRQNSQNSQLSDLYQSEGNGHTLQIKQKLQLNQQDILKSILNKNKNTQPKLIPKSQSIIQKAKKMDQKLKHNHGYLSTKPIGVIVKQLIQEILQSEDEIQVESEVSDDEIQDQNQMSSLKLIKPKKEKHRELINHEELSIQQEINFKLKRQKQIQMRKRQQQIQRIKFLLQQLKTQQQEEKFLKQKLSTLNKQERQQYDKVRQKMELNQMGIEDKLSKLGQLFMQRKQRQKDRKNKIKNIQQQIQSARELGNKGPIQIRSLVIPKDHIVEQILPQKIKVQSKIDKQKQSNSKNINKNPKYYKKQQPVNSNLNLNLNSQYVVDQKQIGKITAKNTKKQQTSQKQQKTLNQQKILSPKLHQIQKQIPKNNKNRVGQRHKKQTTKFTQKKQQILQEDDLIEQESDVSQSNYKQSATLPQRHELEVENQLDLIWPQEDDVQFNHNSQWKIKHQQNEKEPHYNEQTQQQEQHKTGQVYQHWPIDPELAQRIQQIEQKANTYISSSKKISISNISSLQISSQIKKYNSLQQKIPQQVNNKRHLQRYQQNYEDFNSIQNPNEVLVFEEDANEQFNQYSRDENNYQSSHKLQTEGEFRQPQAAKAKLTFIQGQEAKIQKRRVNRSVINLSPNKNNKHHY